MVLLEANLVDSVKQVVQVPQRNKSRYLRRKEDSDEDSGEMTKLNHITRFEINVDDNLITYVK